MGRAIALLTDFGTDDIYVGVMKGVMHAICPDATFIDITHAIEPQNIKQAAFALLNSYKYFAPGTVFLVVVDPGVGSERRLLAVELGDYMFVAPDNGVLMYVSRELRGESGDWVELNMPKYHLGMKSNTFHGRDIFAPVAAYLASGIRIKEIGSEPNDQSIAAISYPRLHFRTENDLLAEVVHIDHFGNLITSIGLFHWNTVDELTFEPRFWGNYDGVLSIAAADVEVTVNEHLITPLRRTYGRARRGEILALIDSNGYLEIAVNQGSAAALLNVKVGDPVSVKIGNT